MARRGIYHVVLFPYVFNNSCEFIKIVVNIIIQYNLIFNNQNCIEKYLITQITIVINKI